MPNSDIHASKEGALREIIAAKILMEQGYVISFPVESIRYDFIAEKYPFIARMQIKPLIKTKEESDTNTSEWKIKAYSSSPSGKKPYTIDDCDFIMAVTNDAQDFAILPLNAIPGTEIPKITGAKCTRRKYLNSFIAFEESRKDNP